MNWPMIFLFFGALAMLGALAEWVSGVREGRGSATGVRELVFPIVVTIVSFTLALWLNDEHEWHLAFLYVIPAVGQGAATGLMSPKNEGRGCLQALWGLVWPLSLVLMIKSIMDAQGEPLAMKAYHGVKRTDWDDPVKTRGAQTSFEWNRSRMFKLKTRAEQMNYVRAKLNIADSEPNVQVKQSRYLVCTDLAQELVMVYGEKLKPDGELGKLFQETLDRYHGRTKR